ncbi:MAG: DUF362 domain-containing protein [bacterium]|nr:DUF362 domain-containing protein [bacterium]
MKKVFFVPAKVKEKGLLEGLEKAITLSSPQIEKEEAVAIKTHFGEYGNTRYIRPTFSKKVVDMVKEKGGQPFLTDTTALYRGKRHSLFSALSAAASHGFTGETMGCPVLIADGIRSTGYEAIVKDPLRLSKIKVASLVFEADFLIVLSHFTFHPLVIPAASIKNVGMGCVTKESKLAMHAGSEVKFNERKCLFCKACVKICPSGALKAKDKKIEYDEDLCIGCGECIGECKEEALSVPWEKKGPRDVQAGILDGFKATLSTFGKNKALFINICLDITQHCDCFQKADIPVIPDIGLLISDDALACDKAGFDLAAASPEYPGSDWDKKKKGEERNISIALSEADSFFGLAKKAGIGDLDYELSVI